MLKTRGKCFYSISWQNTNYLGGEMVVSALHQKKVQGRVLSPVHVTLFCLRRVGPVVFVTACLFVSVVCVGESSKRVASLVINDQSDTA